MKRLNQLAADLIEVELTEQEIKSLTPYTFHHETSQVIVFFKLTREMELKLQELFLKGSCPMLGCVSNKQGVKFYVTSYDPVKALKEGVEKIFS